MYTPKFIFHEALKECFTLNHDCLHLSKRIDQLVNVVSETEVEVIIPQSLSFKPISRNDDEHIFLLAVEGNCQRLRLKNLKHCFSGFENPLKTSLPEYHFFDLSGELKAYNLLKPSKAVDVVVGLRDGLKGVKDLLTEQIETIESTLETGRKVIESVGGNRETFFKVIENPFSKNVSLRFDLVLTHERALLEFENYQRILSQYFEKVYSVDELSEVQTRLQKEIEEEKRRGEEEERYRRGFERIIFSDYQTKKLVEKDVYFSNKNWTISGKCKPSMGALTNHSTASPSASLWNTMLFSQDRSCFGESQFRLMVVSENYLGFFWCTGGASVRAAVTKYENGACHFDGNRYVTELESVVPLKINEWNEFKVEKKNEEMSLTLNGKTRTVFVKGLSQVKYPPHVPFRVGSRYPPSGDGLDLFFHGEIVDLKIELTVNNQ